MPHLDALIARGVQTELQTVEPVISPTVWSSIATGQEPETHGIGDFFGDARDLAAPTIFERLAAQGVRVGLHEYLVTWPPQPLPNGFVVPGWLRIDDTTHPADAILARRRPGLPLRHPRAREAGRRSTTKASRSSRRRPSSGTRSPSTSVSTPAP